MVMRAGFSQRVIGNMTLRRSRMPVYFVRVGQVADRQVVRRWSSDEELWAKWTSSKGSSWAMEGWRMTMEETEI
jgi:hypothetical protein